MNDINNVDDVRILVNSFYKKVLQDEVLAPIFNKVINKEEWPVHLEIMVNFWQTNILFEQSYKGNPMQRHIQVDAEVDYVISQAHFDRWLQLWDETIDEQFSGANATLTKKRAKDMGRLILFKVEQSRKGTGVH